MHLLRFWTTTSLIIINSCNNFAFQERKNNISLWFCYLLVYLSVYLKKMTKEDKEGSNNEYEICPEERFFQNSIGDHLKWIRIQNMVYSCFSFAFHLSCVVPIALHVYSRTAWSYNAVLSYLWSTHIPKVTHNVIWSIQLQK